MNDEFYIKRCFELAKKAHGLVAPNPYVGAVIVKDQKIIGEGFHEAYGKAHAEVEAFKNCKVDTTGATLYVNLEPCCHTNKQTPPCLPLVLEKNIKRIVISNLDPNPHVSGQSVQRLKEAGLEVVEGILRAEGEELNEVFFHWMKTQTPFVHLKSAVTLDGKIAHPEGHSQWITGEGSRLDAHLGRMGASAIVIGAKTLRADNPSLTVRLPTTMTKKQPFRFVFSRELNFDLKSKVFTDEFKNQTFIITTSSKKNSWPENQILRLKPDSPFDWKSFNEFCAQLKLTSLWLEGGQEIYDLFLSSKNVHRLTLYYGAKIMGGNHSFTKALFSSNLACLPHLKNQSMTPLGLDFKISGQLIFPEST
jgi:diaminohydroxyphosphoribosylaminopyrimidine deaminase/5-amino-6-(5-phosphoribosylamino)uracil reductase